MKNIELPLFYRTYGESLAMRLAAIHHTTADPRFVFVEEIGSPKEVLTAVKKSREKTNLLIWEAFTEQLNDGGRDNDTTRLQGTIAVIRKDGLDPESRQATIDLCRKVVRKAMALMRQDAREGLLADMEISVDFAGQAGEKITGLAEGWVGYGFSFDWTVFAPWELGNGDLLEVNIDELFE